MKEKKKRNGKTTPTLGTQTNSLDVKTLKGDTMSNTDSTNSNSITSLEDRLFWDEFVPVFNDYLNDLLELMLEAAGDLDDWRSKRFVASKSGWVGINLNNQLYWVYLLIEDPEVIYFQRFRENTIKDRTTYGIEIEKHKAGSKRCRGYIEDGRYRYWEDDLDLETTSFYSEESSRDDRLKILKDFFKDSLEYADKTWGRGR